MTQATPENPQPLIYAAISAVMTDINPVAKGRQADKYKFRGSDEVYNEVHDVMARHGVFTRGEILKTENEDGKYSSGTGFKQVTLTIRWFFHAKDGSFITHDTVGIGADSGDKAANKAMSVAHKYALIQVFAIPTDDAKDPETDNQAHQRKAAGQAERPATPAQAPAKAATPPAGAAPALTEAQQVTAFQAAIERAKTEAELQVQVNKVFASTLSAEKKKELKSLAATRKAALAAAPAAAAA